GPCHARGRQRDRLLHRPGRVQPGGDRSLAGPFRRRAVRRTLHAAMGRRPPALDRQAGDLRVPDPRPLADRRRFRRPAARGTDVAIAGPDRVPGGGRGLLGAEYPRTYHLPDSPGAAACDGIQRDLSWLDGELVVTEKLDGGNLIFTRDAM